MVRKGCLLLGLALGGMGCLSSGTHVAREAHEQPLVRMTEAPPPPAVTADQVTEANAADIVQAVRREMDYDERSSTAAPAMQANSMKP